MEWSEVFEWSDKISAILSKTIRKLDFFSNGWPFANLQGFRLIPYFEGSYFGSLLYIYWTGQHNACSYLKDPLFKITPRDFFIPLKMFEIKSKCCLIILKVTKSDWNFFIHIVKCKKISLYALVYSHFVTHQSELKKNNFQKVLTSNFLFLFVVCRNCYLYLYNLCRLNSKELNLEFIWRKAAAFFIQKTNMV